MLRTTSLLENLRMSLPGARIDVLCIALRHCARGARRGLTATARDPKELVRVRESLNLSRGLFAVYLRTNVRTLENWEQGRARPNAQAALLINLVKHFPDTVVRLAAVR